MYQFSEGEYVKSMEQRTMAEVITKVLYPRGRPHGGQDPAPEAAVLLRLPPRLRTSCATIAHAALDCTHPTLIIPELMRIFMDETQRSTVEAWDIVSNCVAYTNHTIMSEALETWPQGLVQSLLPRVFEIISEINRRWRAFLGEKFNGDNAKISRNAVIEGGKVHMANMCLAGCYMVNGVSGLHGDILKNDLFRDVCEFEPEKFTYITNGIDHRRWLSQINPKLIPSCVSS